MCTNNIQREAPNYVVACDDPTDMRMSKASNRNVYGDNGTRDMVRCMKSAL